MFKALEGYAQFLSVFSLMKLSLKFELKLTVSFKFPNSRVRLDIQFDEIKRKVWVEIYFFLRVETLNS